MMRISKTQAENSDFSSKTQAGITQNLSKTQAEMCITGSKKGVNTNKDGASKNF